MSLPMTRLDIADYLGLTFETVSRALSNLRKAGVLTFLDHDRREIMLNDSKDRHNPDTKMRWAVLATMKDTQCPHIDDRDCLLRELKR